MTVSADDVAHRLDAERIIVMTSDAWDAIADAFEEIERHATGIAGDLLIVRSGETVAAVEQPSPKERVLRKLEDAQAACLFVQERMVKYERMWDGCGCRIDYYS